MISGESGEGGGDERNPRQGTGTHATTCDFRIAFSGAQRSRSRSPRCTRPDGATSGQRAPRQRRATTGDLDFRRVKSGWGGGAWRLRCGGRGRCLFVGGQDPGEQGAKAPCSPLSFHCRIVHYPLSIVRFPFSCLPAEGVPTVSCRAYRLSLSEVRSRFIASILML